MNMKTTTWFVTMLSIAVTALADPSAIPLPLRILYVGNLEKPRVKDFEPFLKRHFARVQIANRKSFDSGLVKDADVVLLDWQQNEGEEKFPPSKSPIGERDAWTKPLVLLGSAGLHMAAVWDVKGGAG